MKGLCECGCGQATGVPTKTNRALGRVKGVPMRFLRGHAMRKHSLFAFEEDDVTGCWVWQGNVAAGGYGMLSDDGKAHMAHRWHYEQIVGSIPEGLTLDHLCRNKLCVNPGHLEPVTHLENVRRAAKLSEGEAWEIREQYAEGMTLVALGALFGVSHATVGLIVNHATWRSTA